MDNIEYLEGRYKEEQERFNLIEQKSYRLISFLTFIFGGLSYFSGNLDQLINTSISSPMKYIVLLLFSVAFICIVCAWGHTLASLKVDEVPAVPKSKEALIYIVEVEESERLAYIRECYIDTIEKLSKVIDEKARFLEFAYEELTYTAVSVVILVLIWFVKAVSI